LSLLRRAYDHRRDLSTRLPAPALAHPSNPAGQLVTDTLWSPSPIAAPLRRRDLTGDASARSTAIVNAAFDRQNPAHPARHHRSDRTRGDQTTVALFAQPSFPARTRNIKANAGAKSPSSDTTAGANSPAVSSLEAFRTPASVHARAPMTGRRPKTLNDSRPSPLFPEWGVSTLKSHA
jgi:hypothetical protein